mgnify:CR=1 FL=1
MSRRMALRTVRSQRSTAMMACLGGLPRASTRARTASSSSRATQLGQHPRVDPVCPGRLSDGAGTMARTRRGQPRMGHAGRLHRQNKRRPAAATGLQRHDHVALREPSGERVQHLSLRRQPAAPETGSNTSSQSLRRSTPMQDRVMRHVPVTAGSVGASPINCSGCGTERGLGSSRSHAFGSQGMRDTVRTAERP